MTTLCLVCETAHPRLRSLFKSPPLSRLTAKCVVHGRYKQYKIGVCGIAPVKVPGVENVDLTHIVTQVGAWGISLYSRIVSGSYPGSFALWVQHTHYSSRMKEVLEALDLGSPTYTVPPPSAST